MPLNFCETSALYTISISIIDDFTQVELDILDEIDLSST